MFLKKKLVKRQEMYHHQKLGSAEGEGQAQVSKYAHGVPPPPQRRVIMLNL